MIKKMFVLILGRIADVLFCIGVSDGGIRKLQFRLSNFTFGKKIRVGHRVYFRNFGNITLGEYAKVGSFSKFWNYSPIIIGENFLGAGMLVINTAGHDPITLMNTSSPVKIGDNVWCGLNVTILGGVTIGDNVIIGAGSVVTKDIPSNCIAVGIPAVPVKELDRSGVKVLNFFD